MVGYDEPIYHWVCVGKIRNSSNKIVGYRLKDVYGNVENVESKKLKELIEHGDANVINLKLTLDKRLMDHNLQGKINYEQVLKLRVELNKIFINKIKNLGTLGIADCECASTWKCTAEETNNKDLYEINTGMYTIYDYSDPFCGGDLYSVDVNIRQYKNEAPYVEVKFSGANRNDKTIRTFKRVKSLSLPLVSKRNLGIIRSMITDVTASAKIWIGERRRRRYI